MSWIKTGRDFAFPEYKPVWPPDPPFELVEVRADVTLSLKERRISGAVENVFRALRSARKLRLDAVGMRILSVEVEGARASHTYDGEVLEVFFEESVEAGSTVTVRVRYEVVEPRKGVWFVPVEGGEARQAWTQSQPEDTRYWLPTYDYPNRKARVELTIRARKGLVVVANGSLLERRVEGDYECWRFRLDSRIPTYLIAFAVGDFYVEREEHNGVVLEYVVPRGREGDVGRSFSKTKEMIDFFEEYLGVKYPYPKYTQVCVEEFVAGGMENASVTILTDSTLHDEKAHMDFRSEPLVSHELAHQWFGDLVTCRDWSHLWLNEGFATLMAALWKKRELGEEEFAYELVSMMDSYLGEYKGRYARPIVSRVYEVPGELFDAHSYPKGALVLWTLANILGEDVFRRGLKLYLERYSEKNADTEDLRKVFEEVSGRQLDWFFEQYVYNAGHPALKVKYKWLPEEKAVEVEVEQTQSKDSLEEYKVPLEVLVLGEDYEIRKEYVVERRRHVFRVSVPSKPKAVCIDPEFKSFKALTLDVGAEELLGIVKNCKYVYPRVMALRALREKGSTKTVEDLKAILLDEKEFWGVRAEAARTIGSIGGNTALKTLLEALEKVKHPKVRKAVVSALGDFKEKEVGEALVKVLENGEESYYVRAEAAASLARTGYEEAFEALKKALDYPSHNHVIAASALEGLGRIGTEEALEVVSKYLDKDKPLQLRYAATAALGYFPASQKVLDLLSKQARSQHPRVRRGVIVAVSRSLSPRMIPLLSRLQRDIWQFNVRAAREALEKIKKHMEKGEEYRKLREELEKLRAEERRLSERVERLEMKV